jgi:hypothetical protein
MPKELQVHANERVDIPDFDRAASDYTSEKVAFDAERRLLDRRSRVLEGFRITIEDQTATAGQITVHNGTALDRDGNTLYDEDQQTASVTLTLTGATTTFYLEVELVEVDTDTDARNFWDDTFDNGGGGVPDGKEFGLSVVTRRTPTWRVVQPVSTTAFASTADPDSLLIPLAIFTTDGSNIIDGTSTPGLVQVDAASVIEEDRPSGTTFVRVFDSRLLGIIGDDVVLSFGTASAETVTLTANDTTNGIIEFAATANAHSAGGIVQKTGTGRLMREKTDPNDATAHPDSTPRLFQGDEIRGSALAQSKESLTGRDDLNVRSQKDHNDLVISLLRELKFGSLRSDSVSQAPPATFSTTPRYFDAAGGVQGARGYTVSVGNGTTSFGDFNGTNQVPFVAAVAALPSTGGSIYVKEGTYTFASKLVLDRPVTFVGETLATTSLEIGAVADPLIEVDTGATEVGFRDITLSQLAGSTDNVLSVIDDGDLLSFERVSISFGNINVSAGTGVVSFKANRLTLAGNVGGGGVACLNVVSTRNLQGHITDSGIIGLAGLDLIRATISGLYIENTALLGDETGEACIHILGASDRLTLNRVRFTGTQMITRTGSVGMTDLSINNCTIVSHTDTTGLLPMFDFYDLNDSWISGVVGTTGYSSSGSGDPPEVFLVENTGSGVVIENCQITGQSAEFVRGIFVDLAGPVWIRGNSFTDMHRAIDLDGALAGFVTDNVLTSSGANGISGIRVIAAPTSIQIRGNDIRTGSGVDSFGIQFNNGAAVWLEVDIQHNSILTGSATTTTSESKAISLDGIIASVSISENQISAVGAGSAEVRGVHITSDIQLGAVCSINNNRFRDIGNNTAAVQARAINVLSPDVYQLTINNNTIDDVDTTVNDPAISVGFSSACEGLQICNNNLNSVGGSGAVAAGAIQITSSGGDLINALICSNTIDLQDAASGDVTGVRIVLIGTSTNENLSICDNIIRCNDGTVRGIQVIGTTTAATFQNVTVKGNQIQELAATLPSQIGGIDLYGAIFVRALISNNIVHEGNFDDSRCGIRLGGGNTSGTDCIVSNNIIRSAAGGDRSANDGSGIYVDDIDNISVCNNTVQWCVENAGSVHGIRLIDCTAGGIISGNTVMPDNSSTGVDEIYATNSNYIYAIANKVGGFVAATVGSIILTGTGNLIAGGAAADQNMES